MMNRLYICIYSYNKIITYYTSSLPAHTPALTELCFKYPNYIHIATVGENLFGDIKFLEEHF